MNKQKWLEWAEIVDAWRVIPRILLFGYCIWTADVVIFILDWYTQLPSAERSLEASGLAASVVTAVTGLATLAIKFYITTGRDWTKKRDEATVQNS